jgi:beta propeller repeat protein
MTKVKFFFLTLGLLSTFSFAGLQAALAVEETLQNTAGVVSGELIQVTDKSYDEYHPRIDGDVVVFTAYLDGSQNIVYVDLETGSRHQITTGPRDQRLQAVSGRRIVYSDYSGSRPEIYVYDIDADTTAVVNQDPGSRDFPAIDGDRVAYVHTSAQGQTNIWVTDLSAGQTIQVTANTYNERRPSIDGNHVTFERTVDGTSTIILYDLETEAETVLLPGATNQRRPHVDGDRVVFDAFVDGRLIRDLVVYEISTGAVHHLPADGNQTYARISGDWLAFDDDAVGPSDIVLIHLPSGFSYRFTDPSTTDYFNDSDGNRVVFTSNAAGKFDIWMYEFTSNTLNIAVQGRGETTPAAAGTHFYYPEDWVALAAIPETGWKFERWEGDVVVSANSSVTSILMDGDKVVTAVFVPDGEVDLDATLDWLVAHVEDLIADGTLNRGQGRALLATLSAAGRNLDSQNFKAVCNILEAFINNVEAFTRAEILWEEEGEELIRQAEILIGLLAGTNTVNSDQQVNQTASSLLETVLHQVEELMEAGIMQESEGYELIREAAAIMDQLSDWE